MIIFCSVSSCPRDPSVRFHASSDPTKIRFSFEAFQFLGGHDYVFIHCRVHVCDVNDANSRCAKGCLPGNGPVRRDHEKFGNKAQQSDKRAKKPVAQPNEKDIKKVVAPASIKNVVAPASIKKVVAPASEKSTKLHAAAKKLARKPAAQPNAKRAKAPLASEEKVQDHPKAPEMKAVHRIMKRTAEGSRKRGVLGSADLSSKGPFILDIDGRKDTKREPRPKKVFAHAKRSGIERDVSDKNKGKF